MTESDQTPTSKKSSSTPKRKPAKQAQQYFVLLVVVVILLHVFHVIDLVQIAATVEKVYSQRNKPTLMDEFERMGQPVLEQKRREQKIE